MLASLYRSKGNCGAALPHFEASRALLPSHPAFEQGYAFCLADAGHYTEAEKVYEAVLSTTPEAPAARFNLALVQWRLHDAKGALSTLRPLLTNTSDEMVLALGARVAEVSGDTPLAVKLLRSAIVVKPKDTANYLEFAQISFNHHSFQVGIDMIDAGLTQLPDAAQLYVARGVLEMQLSQPDRAVKDFEKAHQLEPQLSLAMDAIGMVDSQQYKQAAALELFRKQVRLHPQDGLLEYLYAETLSKSKSAANAETMHLAIHAAQRSVAIDPDYEPAHDLLAMLWLRAEQPQRALKQALAALKIRPDDDVALYQEILARRKLGQTVQAQALVQQLEVLRSRHAQEQKQGRHYILQEEPGP
jgi:tetratricopeptide (TPR) repeat protein